MYDLAESDTKVISYLSRDDTSSFIPGRIAYRTGKLPKREFEEFKNRLRNLMKKVTFLIKKCEKEIFPSIIWSIVRSYFVKNFFQRHYVYVTLDHRGLHNEIYICLTTRLVGYKRWKLGRYQSPSFVPLMWIKLFQRRLLRGVCYVLEARVWTVYLSLNCTENYPLLG